VSVRERQGVCVRERERERVRENRNGRLPAALVRASVGTLCGEGRCPEGILPFSGFENRSKVDENKPNVSKFPKDILPFSSLSSSLSLSSLELSDTHVYET